MSEVKTDKLSTWDQEALILKVSFQVLTYAVSVNLEFSSKCAIFSVAMLIHS